MTQDPNEEEYLDLFRPKLDQPDEDPSPPHRGRGEPGAAASERDAAAAGENDPWKIGSRETTPPRHAADWEDLPPGRGGEEPRATAYDTVMPPTHGQEQNLRIVGAILGGGCLLLMLLAVVVFAVFQVFGRRGGDGGGGTPTPVSTAAVVATPVTSPTTPVASPSFGPMVSSGEVQVPLAIPVRLELGEKSYSVQAAGATPDFWPPAPTAGDAANWTYGTIVNYILGLAPTPENRETLSGLAVDDVIGLRMSTGLVLDFNVTEVLVGAAEEERLFRQASPQLTVGLLAEDPAQRIVVTASFYSDEAGGEEPFPNAAIGLVGTPVARGPVRVTVIETYQAAAEDAGLPPGVGYLLLDVRVENVGTTVLMPEAFQSFVMSPAGERFPLTLLAEQFAHYGTPTGEPLAPGETVIGSLGYLLPDVEGDQVRWVFNPLPGSEDWIIVPLAFDLPAPLPTAAPSPPAGFARVTLETDDIFIDPADDLLDIGLRIENVSEGVVQVTEADVSLSTWTDGEVPLIAPAPPLPWVIEPGEMRLFQLQFQLPSTDTALLTILGYTFSIENLGGG